MPGTRPTTSRAIFVIPSPGWKVTVAEVCSFSGTCPAWASPFESAIERQAACAAAISSAGLVMPPGSSEHAGQLTSSPPKAPLVTVSMRPLPLIRSPSQVTWAVRSVAIRSSLQCRVNGYPSTCLDQRREGTSPIGHVGNPLQRGLVDPRDPCAGDHVGAHDPVRAVLDLVEGHGGSDVQMLGSGTCGGELTCERHRVARGVRAGQQFLRTRLAGGLF